MTANATTAELASAARTCPSPAIAGVCLAAALAAAAAVAPTGAFSADDALYVEMARAMAEAGSLRLTAIEAPADAAVFARQFAPLVDGAPAPQYPGGYAFIAAPFFAAFGVKGLIALNALSFAASVLLTWSLARRLGADAALAAALFAGATFASTYAIAIWPHMLTLAATLSAARLVLASAVGGARGLALAAAGAFLLALAASVRIDAMLCAAALVLWLRLFGAPADRTIALAFIAGLAPGLFICALINGAKFGVFQPFSYGGTGGNDSIERYTLPMLAFAVAAAASLIIDATSPRVQAILRRPNAFALAAVAIIVAAVAVSMRGPLVDYAASLFTLVVDLQALPEGRLQPGLERSADGWLAFWGLPKKALTQSLPFLPLLLAPLAGFLKGRRAREVAFCGAIIAAQIGFYALNYWHGGMAFNLRYFLPALPFVAILAAFAIEEIWAHQRVSTLVLAVFGAAGAVAAVWFYFVLPGSSPALTIPARLYPQLAIAGALLVALAAFTLRPSGRARAGAAAALACLSIGYAAALSAADAAGAWGLRAKKATIDRSLAAVIPPGSLVLTLAEDLLVGASLEGSTIVRVSEGDLSGQRAAIEAYAAAGRCVFIHTKAARTMVDDQRFVRFEDARLAVSPAAALYAAPALACR